MLTIVRGAIPVEVIEETVYIYRHVSNYLDTNHGPRERFYPSSIGHFIIADFTDSELSHLQECVRHSISNIATISANRILKYTKGCYINLHHDTTASTNDSNTSVIIQLSSPSMYQGGELIIDKKLISLNPGDLVYYDYTTLHEVKPVKAGVRYVANFRCLVTK